MNNNSECYAIVGCHANELSNGRMVHLAKYEGIESQSSIKDNYGW